MSKCNHQDVKESDDNGIQECIKAAVEETWATGEDDDSVVRDCNYTQ